MRITKRQLQTIIREELIRSNRLNEGPVAWTISKITGVDSSLIDTILEVAKSKSKSKIVASINDLIKKKGSAESAYQFLVDELEKVSSDASVVAKIKKFVPAGAAIYRTGIDYSESYLKKLLSNTPSKSVASLAVNLVKSLGIGTVQGSLDP